MDYTGIRQKLKELYPQEKYMDSIVDNFASVFSDERFDDLTRVGKIFCVNKSVISRSQFYRIHPYVVTIYIYLYDAQLSDHGTLDRVKSLRMSDISTTNNVGEAYFADLSSLLSRVDQVGSFYDMSSKYDQIMLKSVVILAWHGLSSAEIAKVRKSDIRDGEVLRCDEPPVKVADEYLDVLKRCADTVSYHAFPSGKLVNCATSPYLLRTSHGHFDEEKIKQLVKRFNDVAKIKIERVLNLANIRRNGVFHSLFEMEREGKTVNFRNPDVMMLIKTRDFEVADWYQQAYTEWKLHFFGGVV